MRRPADERTLEKRKADFIVELAKRCSVYHAARAAGVGRSTVFEWRDADDDFKRAWADALEDALDILEQSLYQRALKADTTAGIFLLKGRRSEIFKDRQDVNLNTKTVDVAWTNNANG